MYAAAGGGCGGVMKMKKYSWQAPAPIAGFSPPPPPQMMRPLIRVVPLHVWGHPSASERPQLVPVWPRHLTPPQPWLPSRPPPTPPPVVGPVPPPMPHDYPNSYCHPAHFQMALTQGILPFFPPQLVLPAARRFEAPPVLPRIHPHDIHPLLIRPPPASSHINAAATTVNPTSPSTLFDAHPSNEKIDAAIGHVLAKPWSALPLGLKPPSLESVMVELQRQGVAKVPPSSASGG